MVVAVVRMRYNQQVSRFLSWLRRESPKNTAIRDPDMADAFMAIYLEYLWEEGFPKQWAVDVMSGIQHYAPQLRRQLHASWKLLGVWRQLESPTQAVPIPPIVALAIAGVLWHQGAPQAGLMVVVAHGALLRTGELLALTHRELVLTRDALLVTLVQSKTGHRKNLPAMIRVTDRISRRAAHLHPPPAREARRRARGRRAPPAAAESLIIA